MSKAELVFGELGGVNIADLIGQYIFKDAGGLNVATENSSRVTCNVLGINEIQFTLGYIQSGVKAVVYGFKPGETVGTRLQEYSGLGPHTVDVSEYERIGFNSTSSATTSLIEVKVLS